MDRECIDCKTKTLSSGNWHRKNNGFQCHKCYMRKKKAKEATEKNIKEAEKWNIIRQRQEYLKSLPLKKLIELDF